MSPAASSPCILLPGLHIIHSQTVSPVCLASSAERVSSSPLTYRVPTSATGPLTAPAEPQCPASSQGLVLSRTGAE